MSVLISNLASSLLASSVLAGAVSLSVTTGEGSKFPTIASSLDFFYVRLGTDESNEVVKITARSSDTLTCAGTVGAWSAGTPVALTICKEIFDYIPRIIATDTTVTVKTSGGDFTSIENALSALAGVFISGGATVTIEIDDGVWSVGAALSDNQLSSNRIKIVGKNTYSKSVTSVQSSSGSVGAYSVILNVNDVSNISTNDYVIILSASGGTTPTYLCGCHAVTNVDSGNSRITIASKHLVGVPSGAVTATMIVVKTILSFTGTNGYSGSGAGWQSIDKLVLKGDGTAGKNGITVNTLGAFSTLSSASSAFGVVNFAAGVSTYNGAAIYMRYSAVSGCSVGLSANNNGIIDAAYSVVTGASGTAGVNAAFNGFVSLYAGVLTGNTLGAYARGLGFVWIESASTAGNTTVANPTVNTLAAASNDGGYIDT